MPPCNGCVLCCRLLGIAELNKPAGKWCDHCAIGRGCNIYDTRPVSCVDFMCFYRTADKAPIGLRPDKCKVVIAPTKNPDVISAHVDPGNPTAWKKEPIYSVLKSIAEDGILVIISHNTGVHKIALKKIGPSIVGEIPIKMSLPDENGIQWFHPNPVKADDVPDKIVMYHTNINAPKIKTNVGEINSDEDDVGPPDNSGENNETS